MPFALFVQSFSTFLYNGLNIRLLELAERCMQPARLVHECDRLLGQTRNIVLEQHEQLIAKEKGSTLQKDHLYTL